MSIKSPSNAVRIMKSPNACVVGVALAAEYSASLAPSSANARWNRSFSGPNAARNFTSGSPSSMVGAFAAPSAIIGTRSFTKT